MWSGTELIGNVSLDRQVRMQNVSGVGCDTAEELIIRCAEQVGNGRQIIVAVAKPLAATQQRVETCVVSGCAAE